VSDDEIIERIDAFCDAVPRQRAQAEEIGPLLLFVPVGAGFPYYARPRTGARRPATALDVRLVRARQRELVIPESFEWIEQVAPDMAAAAAEAGLRVHAHPLLVLDGLTAAPNLPPRITAGVLGADDPEIVQAWSVPAVAFGHPGTAIGEGTVTERDKVAANYDAATIEMLRIRLRAGQSVLAAASGPNGPLAAGSYQLAGGVAEITGIGVLPASRRRGLAAAVTHALAEDALARGASLVFLSATDATVARIYARLGFREIGTAMIAEPPELAGLLAWAAQLVQRRGRAPGQRPALAGEVRLVGVAGPDRRVRQVDRSGRSVD
jgi:ribosomal protein S18 acetylase RimI-like enzyme